MKKVKLLCIPYAGASASVYNKWSKYLSSQVEIYPIELAGRGRRTKEPFYNSVRDAVDDIYGLIKQDLDKYNFAFFGHSMGSVIAYELYYRVVAKNHRKPLHIFFSGRDAPHIKKEDENLYDAPLDELKEKLKELGGTPDELFEDNGLLRFYVPVIRADYRIIETNVYMERPTKISSNITILHGIKDKLVDSDIEEWKLHAGNHCDIYRFDGGHFFINDYTSDVVNIINSKLTAELESFSED